MILKTCRSRRLPPLAVLVSTVFMLAACQEDAAGSSGQTAQSQPPLVTVAAPLRQELIEWQEFRGRFEAVETVDLRARVAGHVQSVEFEDGQRVDAGDLLFVIDPRPFRIAREQADAAIASASARVEFAAAELDRARDLVGRGNIPQSTFDQRANDLAQAQADLRGARAALLQANLDLEYTEVRAPITGRVSDRRVDVGNLVGDETLLTTIVATDPIHFVFDVSEAQYLAYERARRAGAFGDTPVADLERVQVRLPDEQQFERTGRIDFVDNVMSEGTGTIRLRAEFPNADGFLVPGQFGYLRTQASPQYEAILLPDSAILSDQANKIVMTVTDDNVVEPRRVRPGPTELGLRIIRSGLDGSERVVITGLLRARPGAPVTPEEGRIEIPEDRRYDLISQ